MRKLALPAVMIMLCSWTLALAQNSTLDGRWESTTAAALPAVPVQTQSIHGTSSVTRGPGCFPVKRAAGSGDPSAAAREAWEQASARSADVCLDLKVSGNSLTGRVKFLVRDAEFAVEDGSIAGKSFTFKTSLRVNGVRDVTVWNGAIADDGTLTVRRTASKALPDLVFQRAK